MKLTNLRTSKMVHVVDSWSFNRLLHYAPRYAFTIKDYDSAGNDKTLAYQRGDAAKM